MNLQRKPPHEPMPNDKLLLEYLSIQLDKNGVVFPEQRARAAELKRILSERDGNYRQPDPARPAIVIDESLTGWERQNARRAALRAARAQ